MTATRQTKYILATTDYMRVVGHATNADILRHLRLAHPELSATTVHRITTALLARGELAAAPPDPTGAARFDANLAGHDHFECTSCGCLRDINLPDSLLEQLRCELGDCHFGGHLNVQGTCQSCLSNHKENS